MSWLPFLIQPRFFFFVTFFFTFLVIHFIWKYEYIVKVIIWLWNYCIPKHGKPKRSSFLLLCNMRIYSAVKEIKCKICLKWYSCSVIVNNKILFTSLFVGISAFPPPREKDRCKKTRMEECVPFNRRTFKMSKWQTFGNHRMSFGLFYFHIL